MYRMILHDLKNGVIKNKRFIVVLLWFIADGIFTILFPLAATNHDEITSLDLILYFYKGEDPMVNSNSVVFPLFWIMNFIIILFVIMHYMYDDMYGFGIQYITRIKKRITWWISKCIWCFCACAFFFAICICTAIIVTLFIGGRPFDFTNSHEMLEYLVGKMEYYSMNLGNDINLSWQQLFVCDIVVPFMVSWAVCQLQMTLTLFLKPIVSFVINCGIIIFSAYFQNYIPGLIISYGMSLHNSNFINNGFKSADCIWGCLIIIIIAIILGAFKFKKYNFVEK